MKKKILQLKTFYDLETLEKKLKKKNEERKLTSLIFRHKHKDRERERNKEKLFKNDV